MLLFSFMKIHCSICLNPQFYFLDATLTLSNLSTAVKAVDNWHSLGIWLGVPRSRLYQLSRQTSDSVTGKVMMLDEWLKAHPAPSWDIMTEALYRGGWEHPEWHSILMEVKKFYGRGESHILEFPFCHKCSVLGGHEFHKIRTLTLLNGHVYCIVRL